MTDGKKIPKSELWDEFYVALNKAYNSMRATFKMRSLEGLSQDEIAKRLGADKGLISRRLNGKENLTLKSLSFMASAMGCRLLVNFVPYEELGEISPLVLNRKAISLLPCNDSLNPTSVDGDGSRIRVYAVVNNPNQPLVNVEASVVLAV